MENKKKQLLVAAPRKILFGPVYLDHERVCLGIRPHGLLDVLNKHFKSLHDDKAESGLVQFSTYIAYFLMALPAGAFMKTLRIQERDYHGFAIVRYRAFRFIPAAFAFGYAFLIALFVIACGLCILRRRILILRYWGRPLRCATAELIDLLMD